MQDTGGKSVQNNGGVGGGLRGGNGNTSGGASSSANRKAHGGDAAGGGVSKSVEGGVKEGNVGGDANARVAMDQLSWTVAEMIMQSGEWQEMRSRIVHMSEEMLRIGPHLQSRDGGVEFSLESQIARKIEDMKQCMVEMQRQLASIIESKDQKLRSRRCVQRENHRQASEEAAGDRRQAYESNEQQPHREGWREDEKGQCKFFREGWCMHGNLCKFLHGEVQKSQQRSVEQASATNRLEQAKSWKTESGLEQAKSRHEQASSQHEAERWRKQENCSWQQQVEAERWRERENCSWRQQVEAERWQEQAHEQVSSWQQQVEAERRREQENCSWQAERWHEQAHEQASWKAESWRGDNQQEQASWKAESWRGDNQQEHWRNISLEEQAASEQEERARMSSWEEREAKRAGVAGLKFRPRGEWTTFESSEDAQEEEAAKSAAEETGWKENTRVCTHHLRGRCKFGEWCKHRHIETKAQARSNSMQRAGAAAVTTAAACDEEQGNTDLPPAAAVGSSYEDMNVPDLCNFLYGVAKEIDWTTDWQASTDKERIFELVRSAEHWSRTTRVQTKAIVESRKERLWSDAMAVSDESEKKRNGQRAKKPEWRPKDVQRTNRQGGVVKQYLLSFLCKECIMGPKSGCTECGRVKQTVRLGSHPLQWKA